MAQKLLYPVVDGKKKCGECGQYLCVSEFTKYKDKYYSSKCKKCLREYAKKYRSTLVSKEKVSEYHKQYMKIKENRDKKNAYQREYRKQDDVKVKKLEETRNWKKNEKKKAVEYKGNKCSMCGYDKCLTALEFHHVIPNEKDGYKSNWTFERNKQELDKCILVCANCHREIHAKGIWYE